MPENTWGVDWSGTRGVVASNGSKIVRALDLPELAGILPPGARVVVESTFCSYDVEQRATAVAAMEGAGHLLLTVSPRRTARRRKAWYPDEVKPGSRNAVATMSPAESDELDALVIWRIATQTDELLAAPRLDAGTDPQIDAARAALMKLRRTYHLSYTRTGTVKSVSAKEDYAAELAAKIPAPPADLAPYLGSFEMRGRGGKRAEVFEYRSTLLAAIGVAAQFADSRRGVERILGYHAHGAPSQFRSDVLYWTWRPLRKDETLTLAGFQRAVRWLTHRVLEVGA